LRGSDSLGEDHLGVNDVRDEYDLRKLIELNSRIVNLLVDIHKKVEEISELVEAEFKTLNMQMETINEIKELFSKDEMNTLKELDPTVLLSLPDYLRKTLMELSKHEEATAETVSRNTGRSRAIESLYLNQLCRMGLARKKRVGKRVYFSLR